MAKCAISCRRWIAFHRLVLASQCGALSFQHPHSNRRVFLNTGVMASHRDCKAYGRGRWWLISGICSNSDSWRPTSPPLIRAACSVMDITQPLSEGEGLAGVMSHGPMRPSPKTQLLQFARRNCYHFRRGQRINMPSRKTTVHSASGVLSYQAKTSTGLPSCTTDLSSGREPVTLAGWLVSLEKKNWRGMQPNLKSLTDCWIALSWWFRHCVMSSTDRLGHPKQGDKTDWWMWNWAAGEHRYEQHTR